ncbi:hypothetical protein DIPPA_22842 [Diplonema papillatum]|nr:hypothetical protein DIPPA_22842 [Diplonema papillatum]
MSSDDSTYRSIRAEREYEDMAVRAHSTIFSTVGVAVSPACRGATDDPGDDVTVLELAVGNAM